MRERVRLYSAIRRSDPDWVITWWDDGTVTAQHFVEKQFYWAIGKRMTTGYVPHGKPIECDPTNPEYQWSIDKYFKHTALQNDKGIVWKD